MAIRARPGRGEEDYEGDDWDGGFGRGDYGRKRGRRESPSHSRSRRHRCSLLPRQFLLLLQFLHSSTASSATHLRLASTTGLSAADQDSSSAALSAHSSGGMDLSASHLQWRSFMQEPQREPCQALRPPAAQPLALAQPQPPAWR